MWLRDCVIASVWAEIFDGTALQYGDIFGNEAPIFGYEGANVQQKGGAQRTYCQTKLQIGILNLECCRLLQSMA